MQSLKKIKSEIQVHLKVVLVFVGIVVLIAIINEWLRM
jgi:hypothetical protein